MAGQPHHADRRYVVEARRLRTIAARNPNTVCWRDGLTLAQHQQRWPDAHLTWTAGHTIDGSQTWRPWHNTTTVPPPGDWLAPEVSRCNIAAGNDARDHRHRTGYPWP